MLPASIFECLQGHLVHLHLAYHCFLLKVRALRPVGSSRLPDFAQYPKQVGLNALSPSLWYPFPVSQDAIAV